VIYYKNPLYRKYSVDHGGSALEPGNRGGICGVTDGRESHQAGGSHAHVPDSDSLASFVISSEKEITFLELLKSLLLFT
jgi:hypothetical protein